MIPDTIAKFARKRADKGKYTKPLRQVMREALLCAERNRDGGHLFEKALSGPGVSFICEVKKVSPSKGLTIPESPCVDIVREYEQGGADAIPVLTGLESFLGSDRYLEEIHRAVSLPVLKKDFIPDQYQIYEAKTLRASVVLLICFLLDQARLIQYIRICRELGLGVLVEAHSEREVSMAMEAGTVVIGISNRNLKIFEVDFSSALRLEKLVGQDTIFVAGSSTRMAKDIKALAETRVDAVLIGETLMRALDRKMALAGLRGNEEAISIRS